MNDLDVYAGHMARYRKARAKRSYAVALIELDAAIDACPVPEADTTLRMYRAELERLQPRPLRERVGTFLRGEA